MKKTKENNETKALIEEKKNIWSKIKNWFKNIIPESIRKPYKNEVKEQIVKEKAKLEISQNEDIKPEKIINSIIVQAKAAYENYMLNTEFEIGENLYSYVEERIKDNKDSIERVIEINKDTLTFDKIVNILESEKNILSEYKKTIKASKIDDNFMFSQYQVPVGIIGIETDDSKIAIKNIFKSITTRNAIIVIQDEYNKYSIENLILLIVKECFNKFNIDENIIQIVEKEEMKDAKKTEFDILIDKDGVEQRKEYKEKLYIYQEDDYFKEVIENEIEKLKLLGKEIDVLTGEFYECVSKINESRNFGVSIYSQDRKKGYKFINLINSKNVFFNSTLQNAQEIETNGSEYLISKNIISEYKIV